MRSQIRDVQAEMIRQRDLWGEQNHPSLDIDVAFDVGTAEEWQSINRTAVECDYLTWSHILIEEVAEAFHAKSTADLREELVQVAAVALSWIECLDRNAG